MTPPPSVQLDRMHVYPHAYVVTNRRHDNNRRVIQYSAQINGKRVQSTYANDMPKLIRQARNV